MMLYTIIKLKLQTNKNITHEVKILILNQYEILNITLKDIVNNDYNIEWDIDKENQYVVTTGSSLLFDQIEILRGFFQTRILETIWVTARHNKKKEKELEECLSNGFYYNGKKYLRYGKTQSKAKQGVTEFISEDIFEEIYLISQMEISLEYEKIVLPKYEAMRGLLGSTCSLVSGKIPKIILIDEYKKILKDQYIRYAEDGVEQFTDKNGVLKTYNKKIIREGFRDVELSPNDGFGVHDKSLSKIWSDAIGLDYTAIGFQIRIPAMKGYSVEFEFKQWFKDHGIFKIKDVFGVYHNIDDVDCLWNITMFKAFALFKSKYGNSAMSNYFNFLEKYKFKLGISKYSHHLKDFNPKHRLNYQYLQTLDLWNPKYKEHFKQLREKDKHKYDILNTDNFGKIINMAKYSTDLYEKIIKGDKFYSLKFLGINDSDGEFSGKYIKAILTNDLMLKDPCVKKMIYEKSRKAINQMKLGKIYVDGFYHTCVGDIIGYLEYASGMEVIGCLEAGKFYTDTIFGEEDIVSFRSPLVCESEVNKVKNTLDIKYKNYFSHFKNQDVVMINMYDLTMQQQGGADFDGDAFFLTNDPIILDSKIDKPIIIDINDKATQKKKSYTKENIIQYELNSRDNRIGEITTIGTSILNQETNNEEWTKINSDNISWLRLAQGKEIDCIKTGIRWIIPKHLRKYLKRIPYFLLYNYPQKMNVYQRKAKQNKSLKKEDKLQLNAYHSASSMNELCEYVCRWEQVNINWDNSVINTGVLLLNKELKLDDKAIMSNIKKIINEFSTEWKKVILIKNNDESFNLNDILNKYQKNVLNLTKNRELLANYFIKVSYQSINTNKTLCWHIFYEEMLENLKKNSPKRNRSQIILSSKDNENAKEFLGKYYELIEG